MNVLGAIVVAVAAIASITVLGVHGTIDKETVATLLSSIVVGGFALASHAAGAKAARPSDQPETPSAPSDPPAK